MEIQMTINITKGMVTNDNNKSNNKRNYIHVDTNDNKH